MTVNTTNITSGPYTGNGLSDEYSYTFRVANKSQLSVYETDDAGVQTLLVVDTDYTVNDAGVDAGGTITRLAGNLPTDYEWYIRSNYIENQLTAFASQGGFFPDVHEAAMDKLTFLIQQILDGENRSIRLSESESSGVSTELASVTTRANKTLGFTSSGELTYSSGSLPVGTLREYSTVAAAISNVADISAGDVVDYAERTSGNGGGATCDVIDDVGGALSTANDGYNIIYLGSDLSLQIRLTSIPYAEATIFPTQLGLIANGADMSAVIQHSYDFGQNVEFPDGRIGFATTINITGNAVITNGQGHSHRSSSGVTEFVPLADIELFRITGDPDHTIGNDSHFQHILFSPYTNQTNPQIRYVNAEKWSIRDCRFSGSANDTTGAGILTDDGAGGIGGSVGNIDSCTFSHAQVDIKTWDVHIVNSWIWANSKIWGLRVTAGVGNLTCVGVDFLPPQLSVVGRKAAIYLTGAVTQPKFIGCYIDGNGSLATGVGLLAENGVIGLQINGGHANECDDHAIILDSCILPSIKGMSFFGNNRKDNGTHTGSNNASVLTDSAADYVVDALIGKTLHNVVDGSTATVTSNTETTVSGTLSGGTDDDWDTTDTYYISEAGASSSTGSVDILLRDTFGQPMEKPVIETTHLQSEAKLWPTGPAIKVEASCSRDGMRIKAAIHQPGAGGGYDDVEILVESESGSHDGSDNVAILSDSTAAFPTAGTGLVGRTVNNVKDRSTGLITANTATTITATLAGGTDNDWDTDDDYNVTDIGGFTSASEGSFAGSSGTRTKYQASGSHPIPASDTFETINFAATLAYPPRIDQINTQYTAGDSEPRINDSTLPTIGGFGMGFNATHSGLDVHYNISL